MKTMYDEAKFTELVMYVASRLQAVERGGAIKFDSALFFADFVHVRRTGVPITGAVYQKLEQGPAARCLRTVCDRLIANGDAELHADEFAGYRQHRFIPRRDADLTVFSDDELTTIDKVLADLGDLNARQVIDLVHAEAGWRLVNLGDAIPYEAALVGARQVSTPVSRHLEREAADRLGLTAT